MPTTAAGAGARERGGAVGSGLHGNVVVGGEVVR